MSEDKNNGYILLEVIVSIAIITIVLLPLLNTFSHGFFILHSTEINSQAYKLAANTVEIFKEKATSNWSDLETEAENYSIDDVAINNDLFADDYNLKVNIGNFDFNGDDHTDIDDEMFGRKISVVISWENDTREIQVDTLLRKR